MGELALAEAITSYILLAINAFILYYLYHFILFHSFCQIVLLLCLYGITNFD